MGEHDQRVSMKEHKISQMVTQVAEIAKKYAGTQQLRSRIGTKVMQFIKFHEEKDIIGVYKAFEEGGVEYFNVRDGKTKIAEALPRDVADRVARAIRLMRVMDKEQKQIDIRKAIREQ